jgi:hypothetical protein
MTTNWTPGVARAMHELANATPAAPSPDDVRARRLPPSRRPSAWLTAAAVVMAIAAIAGLVALAGHRDEASQGGASVKIVHTRVTTSTAFRLDCPRQIGNEGTFTTTIVDTWADRGGKRWRSRITYPDGSSHDMIDIGSAVYPSMSFERGTNHGARIGCVGSNAEEMVLVSGPDLPYHLDITPELAPDERAYVTPFTDNATPLPNLATDQRGRSSRLWEFRVNGTVSFDQSGGVEFPTTDLQQWWVAPGNDVHLTQRRYTRTVDTLGTASITETLISEETIEGSGSIFSTDGFTRLPSSPRPAPPTPRPTALAPPTGESAELRHDDRHPSLDSAPGDES